MQSSETISIDKRVNLPAAVPLYVAVEWNKKVPSGKRSSTLTSLLCDYLKIPKPEGIE